MVDVLGHIKVGKRHQPLRILQLTDLHQWPAGSTEFHTKGRVVVLHRDGYSVDAGAALVAQVVADVRPDVAVLTGDIIDARPLVHAGDKNWRRSFEAAVAPLVEAGVPWTFVPGNHDDHADFKRLWRREDMLEVFDMPGCISKGAKSFNHTLTVGPTDDADGTSVRLWLFDSGEDSPDPSVKYTPVSADVVQSYRHLSATLPKTAVSLAYFHIPLPETGGVAPIRGRNGIFAAAVRSGAAPWLARKVPWVVQLLGLHWVVGASKAPSTGLFEAFRRDMTMRGAFFGHDHYNDSIVLRDGVYLCFGRAGSFTPPSDWEGDGGPWPFRQGARVVEVTSPSSTSVPVRVETWVQVAEGEEEKSRTVLLPRSLAIAAADAIVRTRISQRMHAAAVVVAAAAVTVWVLWVVVTQGATHP